MRLHAPCRLDEFCPFAYMACRRRQPGGERHSGRKGRIESDSEHRLTQSHFIRLLTFWAGLGFCFFGGRYRLRGQHDHAAAARLVAADLFGFQALIERAQRRPPIAFGGFDFKHRLRRPLGIGFQTKSLPRNFKRPHAVTRATGLYKQSAQSQKARLGRREHRLEGCIGIGVAPFKLGGLRGQQQCEWRISEKFLGANRMTPRLRAVTGSNRDHAARQRQKTIGAAALIHKSRNAMRCTQHPARHAPDDDDKRRQHDKKAKPEHYRFTSMTSFQKPDIQKRNLQAWMTKDLCNLQIRAENHAAD